MRDFFSVGGCLLCDEINNQGALSTRLDLYEKPADRILMETANFLLIPDISPMVPGHSLLITKAHLTCFADLPHHMLSEVHRILNRAADLVAERHSTPLLFEHGSASLSTAHSGACIQHAHIHVLPVRVPVDLSMEKFGDLVEVADAIPSPSIGCGVGEDYLWYRNQDSRGYVVRRLQRPVPCQFVRRAIAEFCDLPKWNWESMLEVRPRESSAHSY